MIKKKELIYFVYKILYLFPELLHYNILFLINSIRLNKPYYFLGFDDGLFSNYINRYKNINIKTKSLFTNKLLMISSLNENLNRLFKSPEVLKVFYNDTELKEFDFRMWDESTILMPVWALDCLPDGTKVVSIDGDEITFDKSKGLDKDERFGATAYGFSISQLRDAAINKIIE